MKIMIKAIIVGCDGGRARKGMRSRETPKLGAAIRHAYINSPAQVNKGSAGKKL